MKSRKSEHFEQLNEFPAYMDKSISSEYFCELRRSVDELFEMELQVVPAITASVDRDEYTGFEEFNEWRDSGCDNTQDPEQFGLEGDEICGYWSEDDESFNGFFPAWISEDGGYVLTRRHSTRTYEQVCALIDLAEEYRLPLGIAVDTMNVKHLIDKEFRGVNSVLYSDPNLIRRLGAEKHLRIESDGELCWTYLFANHRHGDTPSCLEKISSGCFKLLGNGNSVGRIEMGVIVPSYPSYVLGKQMQLLSSGAAKSILTVPCRGLLEIGSNFRFENETLGDQCAITSIQASDINVDDTWLEENMEYCHTPEEEDKLFQKSVVEFEESLKLSKKIIRHQSPKDNHLAAPKMAEESDVDLYDLLPHKLARSLSVVKENLPYDSLCVLMSFLTGLASMLRLGTTVTGNELTDYKVPINFYTILSARSGRKKSPLQKLFVDQPASDVMLKVAQENDRVMKAWREKNRGKGSSDKSAQPVPVDIRINDYTGEAFVQALGKLDEIGRSVLIEREEISALFRNLDGYKSSGKGSDEQQILELYDGGGFRSLRIGDKGRAFSRAGVNIFGTIQPEVLDGLLRNGDASGLWARFSFAAMPDMTKRLPTDADTEKLKAFQSAQKYLKDITSAAYELTAVQYKLDTTAVELFADYELKKQEDAQSTKISAQAALYGKAAGKVLRYAGLLHITEIITNNSSTQTLIPVLTLRKAIELVDRQDRWTLGYHAKLAGVTTDGLTSFERRLHNIALKCKSSMSWSDIRQKMSSTEKQGKAVKDAEETMNKLVALGLGEVTKGPNGGLYYQALKPLPS